MRKRALENQGSYLIPFPIAGYRKTKVLRRGIFLYRFVLSETGPAGCRPRFCLCRVSDPCLCSGLFADDGFDVIPDGVVRAVAVEILLEVLSRDRLLQEILIDGL